MRSKIFLALAIVSFILAITSFLWGIYLLNTITTGFESVIGGAVIVSLSFPHLFLGLALLSLRKNITKGKLFILVLILLFVIQPWIHWAKALLTLL